MRADPPRLGELQAAFRAHVLGVQRDDLARAIVGDRIPATGRLAVYRNHVFVSLTAALAATYPVVHRLVGEAFFARLARAYVAATPPRSPVLAEYGDGFAAHAAGFPGLGDLPYIADVARLEWALNGAYFAPDRPVLGPADLAGVAGGGVADLVLALHPSAAMVASPWPIDRIWLANIAGPADDAIDLATGGVSLAVFRRDEDAAFMALSAGEVGFLGAVASGATLEGAVAAAVAADEWFDFAAAFARLLGAGLFAAPAAT